MFSGIKTNKQRFKTMVLVLSTTAHTHTEGPLCHDGPLIQSVTSQQSGLRLLFTERPLGGSAGLCMNVQQFNCDFFVFL